MESENKKKQNPQVDEEFIMSIMAEGTRQTGQSDPAKETAPGEEKQANRDRPRQKKISDINYGERFLNSHTMTKRGDKSIYIRSEYHERLSRIVQVIGEDKIPLYAYLDNILEHHFAQFEKDITSDFNKKYKPIF